MDIYDFEALAIFLGSLVIGGCLGLVVGLLINPIVGVIIAALYVSYKLGPALD